ncbi:MAG: hypothetical protein XD92_0628 [Proteiniphilum acetatigenes]|uniref:Uncharacterized protein n=1 Tax=Proteiniphilum acetatigenes TaxID=294710 RepID=A0A101HJN1_9BACT|nr:MAG: hypothetical protein XD92_0628 [Proteiniphilum acetatigenes]
MKVLEGKNKSFMRLPWLKYALDWNFKGLFTTFCRGAPPIRTVGFHQIQD